jgi:CheY-like chemotaxis protein
MRALVVDDYDDIAEMFAQLLRGDGYEVVTASSGREAIEKCSAGAFDLVLCDIGMPGMNGFEVVRALRARAEYRQATIIAVTGYSIHDDRKRALALGFDDLLVKPVGAQVLMATIRNLRTTKK